MPEEKDKPESGGFKVTHMQQTPNPDAVQFIMSRPVLARGTKSFAAPEEAEGDPLAEALFQIFGIENVFIKENFVTITKSPIRGWNHLVEEITKTLETRMRFYEAVEGSAPAGGGKIDPAVRDLAPGSFPSLNDEQKRAIIEALFENSIRPALAYDGGGLSLHSVAGNLVRITYQGSCGSCPSSRAGTLHYIETMLRDNLDPAIEVQAV